MKARIAVAAVVLLACGAAQQHVAVAVPSAAEVDSAVARAGATITASDMRARIGFLASDALRGRDTPSPGLEAAAAYLASEFARLGLQPAGDPGSYIQRYPLQPRRRRATSEAAPAQGAPPLVPNVVALLPGSDPALRDTYVIFSAHMDHVGVRRPDATGDSIYNGADDDASGTAALVEMAEAFAALPNRPARSVVFLAVSGEEKGLLGSAYYADHPTIPLEGIVANVNMDMISRNSPDTIVAIGQEYSTLGPLVLRVAAAHPDVRLTVIRDPWPQERLFFRSDHYNFVRKEIPALFFFSGLHEDYHRASDEVEKIDADKAARVARLAFYTAYRIASDPEPPRWTAEGLAQIRQLTR